MNLTPEQQSLGRRNFLKVLAGTPALTMLGAAAAARGPVPGGPVRIGFIGVGGQGRALLDATPRSHVDIRALCDINPTSLRRASDVLTTNGWQVPRHYAEWREMLEKEDLEAVVIGLPLWAHADVTVACLDAGTHVLCEKMMAWDVAGCERMRDAARRTGKVLEVGYQRFYNPLYEAAYNGVIRAGVLGDMYYARLAWHRNATWRRQAEPPSPDYDPSRWGYPTFDHLLNWRLFWKYSQGLFAELGSHQINVANWFFGAEPEKVVALGGVNRFPEGGREVYDHVYGTFEYPGGRTATFTSVESNAFDDNYEMFMGTKGTLILTAETEALLFEEGGSRATGVEVGARSAAAVAQSSETVSGTTPDPGRGAPRLDTRTAAPGVPPEASGQQTERRVSLRREIERFCAAIRVGTPVACGPDRAMGSARACIQANEAIRKAPASTT